ARPGVRTVRRGAPPRPDGPPTTPPLNSPPRRYLFDYLKLPGREDGPGRRRKRPPMGLVNCRSNSLLRYPPEAPRPRAGELTGLRSVLTRQTQRAVRRSPRPGRTA